MQLQSSTYLEVSTGIAETRVQSALRRNAAADLIYPLGDKILVSSDLHKTLIGPFVVLNVQGRMITIQTREEKYRQMFSVF